ncbi:putative sporulation protein YtxC [Haloimpatiens lingqiaonensis]|uniref:putative sporulation protein YtxC n=1 Tax=Haloimpatiens lingqiaonensis TaxID=1380675 RepID=UPI0010FE9D44|nr:putative sporulation protein YtxC [Haloimpatiens lingqiaonensis]
MLLLTIVFKGEKEELIYDINEIEERLRNKDIHIGIYKEKEEEFNVLKIFSSDNSDLPKKTMDIIYYNLMEIIYNHIILEFYYMEVDYILNEDYFFLGKEEIEEVKISLFNILTNFQGINDEKSVYFSNRMNEIKEDILNVIKENNLINIHGYLRFRIREIKKKVCLIIDKIIESIMVEKEYDEFIKLLKYFVGMQDNKINKLHIFIDNKGDYIIKDEKENNIMNKFKKESFAEDIAEAVDMEDVIISGLVTSSPKKIIIHGANNCKNKEFINTIENVFESRVTLCDGCEQCRKLLSKNVKNN